MLSLFTFQKKKTNKQNEAKMKGQQKLITTKDLKQYQNLETPSTFYMILTDFVSQYKSQSTLTA